MKTSFADLKAQINKEYCAIKMLEKPLQTIVTKGEIYF